MGSARRGKSSPLAGDSVDSGSPIAIEAVKPESSATASPLAPATAVNLNGTAAAVAAGAASGTSEPMDTTETDEIENVAKRRKTGTGSRGVANLTPEQLAKKRANGKCFCYIFSLLRPPCLLRNVFFFILPLLELLHLYIYSFGYMARASASLVLYVLYISPPAVSLITNEFDLFSFLSL